MKQPVVLRVFAALICLSVLAWGQATPAQTPAQTPPAAGAPAAAPAAQPPVNPTGGLKFAVINIQRAIVDSSEGKKAAEDIQKRFTPVRTELERMQKEIADLQERLKKGENTLADDVRAGMARDIDRKTKDFNRKNEDAQADLQGAEQQTINTIGQKVLLVIDQYSKRNGYDLVLDVSSPQTPVLWAGPRTDITDEIIGAFNILGPTLIAPAPAAPAAAAPAKPAPATPAKPKTGN